ncbi:MAG: hypothetical protein M3360_03165 [Actinomycetota bacterium]|nr:hypothetical protein [Actinomycetota bacterium]
MNKTSLGDDFDVRVKREPRVRQGRSRLEGAAQGFLVVLLGGLFMTLVVMYALVFGH